MVLVIPDITLGTYLDIVHLKMCTLRSLMARCVGVLHPLRPSELILYLSTEEPVDKKWLPRCVSVC